LRLDPAVVPPPMMNSPLMAEQVRNWLDSLAQEMEKRQKPVSRRKGK
jgi:hypothetical protein